MSKISGWNTIGATAVGAGAAARAQALTIAILNSPPRCSAKATSVP